MSIKVKLVHFFGLCVVLSALIHSSDLLSRVTFHIGCFVVVILVSWWIASWVVRRSNNGKEKLVDPVGKSVIITGCNTGIGYRTALRLNEYGFNVYATVRQPDGEGARKLNANARHPSRMNIVGPLDVTNSRHIDQTFEYIKESIDNNNTTLWAVVNNAGLLYWGELEWTTTDRFRSVSEVNLMGTAAVTRKFLPLIRQSKGRIVNIASVASRYTFFGLSVYSASKSGLLSLTDGLRREMYKFGVKVVDVEPFLYSTPMLNDEVAKIDDIWNESPVEVKEAYGQQYARNFKNFVSLANVLASKDVDSVSQTIVEAVTCATPETSYFCGSFVYKIMYYWLANVMPIDVADCINALIMRYYSIHRPYPKTM